jgi:hypothetical protein
MNDASFLAEQTVEIVPKAKPACAENRMQASFFLDELDDLGVRFNELTPLLPGPLRASVKGDGGNALPCRRSLTADAIRRGWALGQIHHSVATFPLLFQ